MIEHRDGIKYHINMKINEQGKVTFEGLPEVLEYKLSTFTDAEKRLNPLTTLQAIIREREG